MPYNTDDIKIVAINKDTTTNNAIIAAPGAGARIAVDYLILNPSGGANVITLTGSIALGFSRNDNQELILENSINAPKGIFPCNPNQALSLGLSANTQVEGYILYRILNQ